MKKKYFISSVKEAVTLLINLLKSVDCEKIKITVEDYSNRTVRQNSYFHGPLMQWWKECVKEASGVELNDEEAKQTLKKYCDIGHKIEINGKKEFIPKETSKMSKKEFAVMLEQINEFGVHWFGVAIPLPDWDY